MKLVMAGALMLLMLQLTVFAPIASAKAMRFYATVQRMGGGSATLADLPGRWYGLVASDGTRYEPVNLPAAYRKDDLSVLVEVRPRPDVITPHTYGKVVEVVRIEKAAAPASAPKRRAVRVTG